jgi:hypothetical protein
MTSCGGACWLKRQGHPDNSEVHAKVRRWVLVLVLEACRKFSQRFMLRCDRGLQLCDRGLQLCVEARHCISMKHQGHPDYSLVYAKLR